MRGHTTEVAASDATGGGDRPGDRGARGRPRWSRAAVLSSYRVSDYFVAPGLVRHELWLCQLRHAADLLGFLGLPRPVVRANYPPTALCPGGTASACGGRLSPRGMCTGLPIIRPPASFSYRTFPVMYGTGGPVDGPGPADRLLCTGAGPGPDPRPVSRPRVLS